MDFGKIINSIKEFFKKLFGSTTTTTTLPPTTTTTTTPPVTTDTTTTTTMDPLFSGKFVDGDSRDKGSEIHCFWNTIDVRCLANDVSGSIGEWYFMSNVITQTSALILSGKVATAKSFISPITNKKYRFMGFREKTSASSLITTNPLTVVTFSGTFRAYWNTVE